MEPLSSNDLDDDTTRSFISGLTELTQDADNDTKERQGRERGRGLPTGSSSTTLILKTSAFLTTSAAGRKNSSNKFNTTMTTTMTVADNDTNGNTNNSRSRDQIQNSSSTITTTGHLRNEADVSSLVLSRLLYNENTNSFSTRRFELSFQNKNTIVTHYFPMIL